MEKKLNQAQLLQLILDSIEDSNWKAILVSRVKPFHLRVFNDEGKAFDVHLYVWNCTHGGGKARAEDEYRIQLTGVVPKVHKDGISLLLGWHSEFEVFAAWDMNKHSGQASRSPSAQVKRDALLNAHTNAFAAHKRENNEIVISFRPEFLIDYALNADSLHKTGKPSEISLLNSLGSITDKELGAIPDNKRKEVIKTITQKYRAHDFKKRVLGAYGHRCAMCGLQLKLIDAAHIVPVADPTSTDETSNGVALCKLHHAAMDRNFVSFDETYSIEVSRVEAGRLKEEKLIDGLGQFEKFLKPALLLPADRRDYPKPAYIKRARQVRRWL